MDTVNKEWNIKVDFITFYKFSVTEGTYVRVLWNDLDDEYCVIQWYDSEENISEHGLQMFEIFESDTHEIIANKKTAGIITP